MIALAIFAALQVADVTLTTLILRRGGRELNPAMRWLMDKLGTVPGLASGTLTAKATRLL